MRRMDWSASVLACFSRIRTESATETVALQSNKWALSGCIFVASSRMERETSKMKPKLMKSAFLMILILTLATQAAAQETKLKWFGHAAFSITTPNGKVLLIDPWLSNPAN